MLTSIWTDLGFAALTLNNGFPTTSNPGDFLLKDYNGMFPCFLGGLLWRLFFNISKDRII